MSASESISVVIPSYNGLELLKEHLPGVKEALENYDGGGEIVVVEDGGSDGTAEWLKTNHPDIDVVCLEENRGFATAANSGVEKATNDVVALLNNDMTPDGGFFAPLVKRLRGDESIFASTAKSVTSDGGNESISLAEMDDGLLQLRQPGLEPDTEFDRPMTLFHSAGGFSAYRKDRFIELGGFDPIYHPFYWEDVDLSYRAWRRGWKSVYEPRAVVMHRSHGTIGKLYSREEYDLIQRAHLHLFHMVNLEETDLEKYLRRVNRLMSEINLYDRGILRRGFYKALSNMDEILARRKKLEPGRSLEDILEASSNLPLEAAE